MAINPLTGQDEELTSVDGSSSVFTNQNNELTTGMTPINPTDNSNEFTESEQNLADTLNNFNIEDEPTEIVAKTPTKTDAVVIGDETTGEQESTSIFDGLTEEQIDKEVTSATPTDLGKKLMKEIRNKQNLERIKGKKDPLLASIGYSTVKEEDKVASTVSGEVALNIVDSLLAGNKDILPLTGDQPLSVLRNDKKLTDQLTQQGYSAEEIQAVKNARDTRLKEQRVSRDATTLIEDKEEELRKRVEREQSAIREQSTRNQNLLQRQRALRGVGLSTATEGDIADMVKAADKLANAAQAKANDELARYKAYTENASAETIKSLEENFNNSVKALNSQILQQTELENKLIQQGKLESEAGFNNLVESLKVAGVDTEGIDKDSSELVGHLVDKFGNEIKVNGERVPVGGASGSQSNAISGYVNLLKVGGAEKISSVPAELKNQVIAQYDMYAQNEVLSNEEEGTGLGLLNKLSITPTEKMLKRASVLIRDKGLEEATKVLSGFNTDVSGPTITAFENISGGLSKEGAKAARIIIEDRLANGNIDGAIDKLISSVDDSLNVDQKKAIAAEKGLLRGIGEFTIKYAEFLENNPEIAKELEEGSKLGQTQEEIMQYFNSTGNEELAGMMSNIAIEIQTYRKNLSGAAFSESEAKEYADIFPGPFKSTKLNKAKIENLLSNSRRKIDDYYGDKLGSPYEEIFPQGIHKRFDPFAEYNIEETTSIELDESENTDLDNVFGPEETVTETTTTTFKPTSSGFQFDDSGLTNPEQTGGTNGIPTVGFTEKVNLTRPTGSTNVAKDTNNPGNITADSIPSGFSKEEYGKEIGATGTYLSPNGREYFIFPDVTSGTGALERDITAKITGNSRNIKPTDSLERFQRVYVGETSPGYLSVLTRITGAGNNTPIKDIDPKLLTQAVMEAEGFTN